MSFTVSLSNLQVYTLPVIIFLVLIIAGVVIKLRKYKRLYHEADDSLHMYESLYFNADEKLHAYIYTSVVVRKRSLSVQQKHMRI